MKARFTISQLEQLQKDGKIRGFELTAPEPKKKRSKYGNKKIEVDGILFDSKKEAARYTDLKLLLKAGEIGLLERQVVYQLGKIAKYIADFKYIDTRTGETIVEDVKSEVTRKLPVYRIKKKMMKEIHGLVVKEV